jgi:aminotransferase
LKSLLSERVAQLPPSSISRIFERAVLMEGVVHLEVGEPDFDTPEHIREAAREAMDEGYTHYTSAYGYLELREAIAEKTKRELGIDADPATEIAVTPGGSNAIYCVFQALLDPGDEVLVPDPAWPHYEPGVRLAGGVPVPYPLREENEFRPRAEDLATLITPRTKMVVLNSPSNPAGAVVTRRDLEAVAGLVVEHGLLVLSDEVYEKIIFDGLRHESIAALNGLRERTVLVNSFSKTYAMTGWRVGYLIAWKELVDQVAQLVLYTSACTPSIAQRAALAALQGPQDCVARMVEEYRRRRDYLVKRLEEIEGVSCVRPRGSFYAFPNIRGLGLPSWELAERLLAEARVATIPGAGLGRYGEGHLRLSFATSLENLEEGLGRLEAFARRVARG